MLTNQQAAIIAYLERINEHEAGIKPTTVLEVKCATLTMKCTNYQNFTGTLNQLRAYYELLNAKRAEALAA